MASEIIKGLFGFSPQELSQQQENQDYVKAMNFARLDPLQQTSFLGMQGINSATRGLGGAARELFGIQDPEVKENSLLEQNARELLSSGVDPMSSQGLSALIQKMNAAGARPQTLERLSYALQNSRLNEAKLNSEQALAAQRMREGKANLPREVQIAQMLNDPNVSEDVKKTLREQVMKEKTQNDPEFVKLLNAYEAAPAGSERKAQLGRLIESEIQGKKTRGTTSVTINQPAAPSAKKLGEAAGTEIGKAAAGVENQQQIINASKQALELLDKGIYTGPYAQAQQVAAKLTRGAVGNLDKVVNTESFLNTVRGNVIPMLAAFGGNDSNEEKQFLERLVGGDITAEPEAIRRAVVNGMRKAEANIERLRKQIKAAEKGETIPIDADTNNDPLGIRR